MSDVDLLALTALCFVAGSIGYRPLPIVAAQLEKRLGEVEKKAERVDKAAKEGSDQAAVTSNVLIALKLLDRNEELSAVVDQTISRLEALAQQFPQERALYARTDPDLSALRDTARGRKLLFPEG